MAFSKYVRLEVALLATFNYHEPSWPLIIDRKRFTVYHTKHPRTPEPNLVVIENDVDPEELYFRVFLGKYPPECQDQGEEETFFNELRATVSAKHKIRGDLLEDKILSIVEALNQGRFDHQE